MATNGRELAADEPRPARELEHARPAERAVGLRVDLVAVVLVAHVLPVLLEHGGGDHLCERERLRKVVHVAGDLVEVRFVLLGHGVVVVVVMVIIMAVRRLGGGCVCVVGRCRHRGSGGTKVCEAHYCGSIAKASRVFMLFPSLRSHSEI